MLRFIKFCTVGGIGAIVQLGTIWILTENFGIWYMISTCIGVGLAVTWNFTMNSVWTFRNNGSNNGTDNAEYEWKAFYDGNLIQKWWKQKIATIVWNFAPYNSIVLDIACGSSPIIGFYENAVGVDLNLGKLNFIRDKFPRLTFIRDNAEVLKFEDNSFDTVLCIECIEHLNSPERCVQRISRVTKQGGVVVIATPDFSKWWWDVIENFTEYKNEHVTKFTRTSLEALCKSNGLKPVKYKYVAGCDLVEMFEKV